uniref:Solute carrier family 22 member 7b, tandem duplicate 3 n=1 Tax=Cynoglossus semilaevis TaxID=244447 RepID=A0A3P8UWN0_CYNSE
MKFENVLADVNGFGRFQIMIIAISFIGRFTLPCHFMLNNFIAAVPSHRCDISALDDGGVFKNLSETERLVVGIPLQDDGTPSSCVMFAEPQYHLLSDSFNTTELPIAPCQNGWVYDNSTFKSTITSQWDLVCERRGENKATATIFFVGVMFGNLTFGSLSDRYGRRIMLLVSYVTALLFATASAFSTSYTMFAVLRFFTGFSITEMMCHNWRMMGFFFFLLPTAIAYFVNDWRLLIISITAPLILSIAIWRWVPESSRWLIARGNLDQAKMYLTRCASMNRKERPIPTLTNEVSERYQTYSYIDLVRTPKMRKLAFKTGLLWLCIATTFYGISFNLTGFGLDIYLAQFSYAAVELPAKLAVYYLLDKVGRRRVEASALLLAGVCLSINIVVPKDLPVVRAVVAVVGKGFSSASFATIVLYSSELYPTVVRQNGLGYNSFMARLGVAVAPMILLLDSVWKDLPQVVLCSTAVIGGIIARTLPETRNKFLPETIEDIERPTSTDMNRL